MTHTLRQRFTVPLGLAGLLLGCVHQAAALLWVKPPACGREREDVRV